MESIGTYFFFALVLGFGLYLALKNKKIKHPTADEERVFNPAAPSNPKLKKEPNKTGLAPDSSLPTGTPKTKKTVEQGKLDEPDLLAKTSGASSQFDLENEVKQLQARTGWDYDTAKAYCLQSAEYHQKIAEPARLKNN
jgi:hypothetical protein